jgi:hypothetical protein
MRRNAINNQNDEWVRVGYRGGENHFSKSEYE